jgi:hypothetical protein
LAGLALARIGDKSVPIAATTWPDAAGIDEVTAPHQDWPKGATRAPQGSGR